ncbi:MAG: terpene synthase family protein [Catenulispora sp.]
MVGDSAWEVDVRRCRIPLPFWSQQHPLSAAAQHCTQDWAHRHGLIRSDHALSKFEALGYGRLTSYACSTATPEHLQLMVDWNTLFFVFDDLQGNALTAGRPEAYERLRRLARQTIEEHGGRVVDHPALHALSDLCRRTFPGRSPAWTARFELNLEIWLTGHARENAFRLAGVTPTPDEYIWLRRDASTVYPNCDLIELTECVEVPDALYFCGRYRELAAATADIMCWINDIHSLPAEAVTGDPMNLIVVLRKQHHLSMGEALRDVAAMISARVGEYQAAAHALTADMDTLKLPAEVQDGVRRCVRDQGSWAAGMELWDRTDTIRHAVSELSGVDRLPSYAEKLL